MLPDIRQTAENMIAVRGFTMAQERCALYMSGRIKSENPKEFWHAVACMIADIAACGSVQNSRDHS